MNKDKLGLVFLTYELANSSYFLTTQLPLLQELSTETILIKAVRVIRSSELVLLRKYRETQNGVHIITFVIQRNILSISNLKTLIDIGIELRKEVGRSYRSILWYRSLVPTILLLLFQVKSPLHYDYFIYDSDGLAADENREYRARGKFSLRYFIERALEIWAVSSARIVLVRSKETIRILKARSSNKGNNIFLELINARDPSMFKVDSRASRNIKRGEVGISKDDFVVIYAGSIGIQYMTDAMFQTYLEINRYLPNSKFVMLVPTEFHQVLRIAADKAGIPTSNLKLIQVLPHEMSSYLNLADLGFSFRHASESMQHVRPLKSREYLLCGVPLVYTSTTADSNSFPKEISFELDFKSLAPFTNLNQWIADDIIPNRENIRKACRQYAINRFNIKLEANNLMVTLSGLPRA